MKTNDKTMRKLLVISQTNPLIVGGIQNLGYLLKNYPKELYWILTRSEKIDKKGGTYNPEIEADSIIFFDNAKKPNSTKKSLTRILTEMTRKLIRKSKLLITLAGPLAIAVKIFLIIKDGLKIIKKRNIEILLGVSDGGPVLISTYFLSKISKRPYFLLFFDLYKDNNLRLPERFWQRYLNRFYLKTLRKLF